MVSHMMDGTIQSFFTDGFVTAMCLTSVTVFKDMRSLQYLDRIC